MSTTEVSQSVPASVSDGGGQLTPENRTVVGAKEKLPSARVLRMKAA